MTRAGVARVAGVTFLLYIAVKVSSSILFEGSLGSGGAGSRLASVAVHASNLRVATVLALASCVCALVLGVSLYFYTRSSHAELSIFVLICRTAEAVLNGVYALGIIALVFIATASTQASQETDATLVMAIARSTRHATLVMAFFLALGTGAFAWVLLRARLAPRYLAALGLLGSVPPIIGMPLQIVGALRGFPTQVLWILLFLFEIALGIWLLTSGGRDPEGAA
ncbi:MAG TPA: DUF4386 domain-containing protein [Thermoanaerobaculia bacterium]|nr:DUF4386 domain-containing protein [Thermoanaerobaculia bacterium]